MKRKKMFLMLVFSMMCIIGFSVESDAAASLKINTLMGKVFQDNNRNEILDLAKFEIGIKGQPVALFSTLEDAEENMNPIKSTSTNVFGDFTFDKLKKGTYYIRYSSTLDKYKIPVENEANYKIFQVKVNNLMTKKNLPLVVSTNFNVVPFVDTNWNGKKEDDENLAENKSFIIFDIDSLKKAIDEGTLTDIDTNSLITDILKTGNIDLAEGVYIRTAKSQKDIKINDAQSGVYVILRSPVNFTLSDILNERQKLELLISILANGNYQQLLENPELFEGSDINTNNPNTGVKLFADTIQGLVKLTSFVDTTLALENEKTDNVIQVASQVESLLRSIPSFRIGMIDYFGNMYDLTGLKIRKTNTFYFGVREFANVEIDVFYDKNSNGKQDFLELSSYETVVNLLNEYGDIVDSEITSSKSGKVKFKNVPYNTDFYVEVVADRATTLSILPHELPTHLQERNITKKVYFDSNYLTSKVSQKIGVIGNNSIQNNIKVEFPEETLINFKNMDRKTNYNIIYYVNDNGPFEVILSNNDSLTIDVGQNIDNFSGYLSVNGYLIPLLIN